MKEQLVEASGLASVHITREHIAECNRHTPKGSVLGCPMCFLRAEYAFLEWARRHPEEVDEVLKAAIVPIREQVLRQESEQ